MSIAIQPFRGIVEGVLNPRGKKDRLTFTQCFGILYKVYPMHTSGLPHFPNLTRVTSETDTDNLVNNTSFEMSDSSGS